MNPIGHRNIFVNAQEAFEYWYKVISHQGIDRAGTKTIYNLGGYMIQPKDRIIKTPWRNFNPDYSEAEWIWYQRKDRNLNSLKDIFGKVPKIWLDHADENGDVWSNYGWQWARKEQLDKCILQLLADHDTRQAVISIYDGKEKAAYQYDTPCTLSVHFQISEKKLCMTVSMRSCDLWFGFCNDQYCFSKLQEYVAEQVGVEIGWYYHFVSNFHIYEAQLNRDDQEIKLEENRNEATN